MTDSLVTACYIAASALFILSLGGLSRQESARRGNLFGILGMILALVATTASSEVNGGGYLVLGLTVAPAVAIGAVVAARVNMTAMPQLIAILHSFVGAAAVLVGVATHIQPIETFKGPELLIQQIEIFVGVCIGAATFTGSIVAFFKLQGLISGKPLTLPARHGINLGIFIVIIWLAYVFKSSDGNAALIALGAAITLAGLIGIHVVMAIGGADMPVVVSMLNSYSGWSAAAAGFMLNNDLLIIVGALVGSSGAILSFIMCRGMNRSFLSVVLGGFGTDGGVVPALSATAAEGEARPIDIAETVERLREAKEIVIVPGYGMAVAQAQHALAAVVKVLGERGARIRFAIHPVAGRLPGHMNVLLAEARIPYDIVLEMNEINDDFPKTDVALVIGANDIVNPSALTDPSSPIAGMPVLEVWNANLVVVMKRSMASGYAGVQNPLFFHENTRMLFGDAKDNTDAMLAELQAQTPAEPAPGGVGALHGAP